MTIFRLFKFRSKYTPQEITEPQEKSPLSVGSTMFSAQIGQRAIVSQTIEANHLGRIYYQNTYWFGCGLNDAYIPEGTVVEVLERHGTTWLVRPCHGA